jgi:hypothetical protein
MDYSIFHFFITLTSMNTMKATTMKVINATRGSRVSIKCVGGCRLRSATIVRARTQSLTALFATRRLPLGAMIEVRITKVRAIGRYFRYTFTSTEVRSTECRISLAGKLTRCASG